MSDIHASLTGPVGRIDRHRDAKARKKDRLAAVRYGVLPAIGHRGAQWSKIEQWVLNHDIFLGTIVVHSLNELQVPAWERPSLIRLAAFAMLPLMGGVLIDSWSMLGDDLSRAVVLEYLLRNDRHAAVRIGSGLRNEVTKTRLDRLIQRIDGMRYEEAHIKFIQAAGDAFVTGVGVDKAESFGCGPKRDAGQALRDAQLRREAGWSDANIRQYLELYGYTNASGTVGRWSHEQFQRLWR